GEKCSTALSLLLTKILTQETNLLSRLVSNSAAPSAYLPLVEYALKLPASLRVKLANGKVIRKYVLRRLAARLSLPDSVVDRPKKAVQYSSGVQKVLLKEAKRQGMSLGKMLESFTR